MKLKSTVANNLMVLLSNISREKLFWEGMQSVENKWKAMTIRLKIINLIKEANKELVEKIDGAMDVLKKYQEEGKQLESQYEEPKDEKAEDKKVRLAEKRKAFDDIDSRLLKELTEKTGLVFTWYEIPQRVGLPRYKNEDEDKEIEVKFDAKFNHLDFIREQFEKNVFELRVSDEVITEIVEALGI